MQLKSYFCQKIEPMVFINIFPDWDVELFKFINGMHVSWLDPVMRFLSSPYSWIILFVIVAYFMIRHNRYWGIREIILILCTVTANSILNNIIKVIVKRPRPCANDELVGMIHVLEDCGNQYSFFSAHSSNAFCLAICTAIFFRNKYYSFFVMIWASVVAYSRIYVGKHYPIDVIVGILFGIVTGFAGNILLRRYREKELTVK